MADSGQNWKWLKRYNSERLISQAAEKYISGWTLYVWHKNSLKYLDRLLLYGTLWLKQGWKDLGF